MPNPSRSSSGCVPESAYYGLIASIIPDVDFHQNHYARQLDRVVIDGARWLDVGAGSKIHDGYGVPTPTELASRCARVVGLDFEVEHLRRNMCLTEYAVGGADAIPFPTGSFDLVTANMVLEHLQFPVQVLREVARVLVPGGRFVFVTPNLNHPMVRVASIVLRPQTQRVLANRLESRPLEHVFPTFYRANTSHEIESLAVDSGLITESLEVVRNIPFLTRPSLATWLECHFIRACRHGVFRRLGADILGVLRKPTEDRPGIAR